MTLSLAPRGPLSRNEPAVFSTFRVAPSAAAILAWGVASRSSRPGAFKVFYKGQPLAKAKLELIAESGWKREFHTDADGAVETSLPWRGGYLIEVVHLDATAGSLGSEAYDSARSVTTLSFRATSGIEPLPTPPVTTPKR